MATTSKFIQLSSSVLLEYIYADLSQITTPGNPYNKNTADAPLFLLENNYVKNLQVWNSDAKELDLQNVRNRSFVYLDAYKIALTDINRIQFFNDYKPAGVSKMTSSDNLPIIFPSIQPAIYDTIKLHLIQGFNFENHKGLTLSCKIQDKFNKDIILNNTVFNDTDNWYNILPKPFFFGGKIYDRYIETKILSSYKLIYDFWVDSYNADSVVSQITNGIGVKRNQLIQLKFGWINSYVEIDGQTYAYIQEPTLVDIPLRDQFESISAHIAESKDGDFIEFYGKFNGDIISTFINDLNRSGNEYILLHDLILTETIKNLDNSISTIKTAELQLTQDDNYEVPNVWRPVIKNPNAISYNIDYTIRLYNKNDNSQVWKTSNMTSYDTQKFGKYLSSINLGTVPIQPIVFNKKYTKEIIINTNVTNTSEKITSYKSPVPSINQANIAISFSVVGASGIKNSSTSDKIYDNGTGEILLPKYDSYQKFNFYTKVPSYAGGYKTVDISKFSNETTSLVLEFAVGKDFLEIYEYTSIETKKTFGEIVFFISSTNSNKILNSPNKEFNIFTKTNGIKTFLYAGKYYTTEEYVNNQINKQDLKNIIKDQELKISKYKENIKVLNNSSGIINDELIALRTANALLTSQISANVSKTMSSDTAVITLQTALDSTKLQLANTIIEKNNAVLLSSEDDVERSKAIIKTLEDQKEQIKNLSQKSDYFEKKYNEFHAKYNSVKFGLDMTQKGLKAAAAKAAAQAKAGFKL